jgi:hypothetical protein
MVPNPKSDPHVILVGFDPGTTTAVYKALSALQGGITYVVIDDLCQHGSLLASSSVSNFTYLDILPKITPEMLRTLISIRRLSKAEKELLRELNEESCLVGIQTCRNWHARSHQRISTLPQLHARFDRRIPCWRAGRWKSLT